MRLSDKRLAYWYRRYNQLYFNNELPEDVEVYFAPNDDDWDDAEGRLTRDEHGVYTIRIDPKYSLNWDVVRITLLHEMAHIKVWPVGGHGRIFKAEIRRLMQAGAYVNLV